MNALPEGVQIPVIEPAVAVPPDRRRGAGTPGPVRVCGWCDTPENPEDPNSLVDFVVLVRIRGGRKRTFTDECCHACWMAGEEGDGEPIGGTAPAVAPAAPPVAAPLTPAAKEDLPPLDLVQPKFSPGLAPGGRTKTTLYGRAAVDAAKQCGERNFGLAFEILLDREGHELMVVPRDQTRMGWAPFLSARRRDVVWVYKNVYGGAK